MTTPNNDSARQSDLLLWVAGGVVAAVGIAWLVILKPWGGDDAPLASTASPPERAAVLANAAGPPPADDEETPVGDDVPLDNPLRMAELAYQAGMLVEPEEYSAWTLYSRAVKTDPRNAAALEGLNKVADDLVRRGETALEQGRFDDARATVERIRAALPSHPGAKALADKIWPATGGLAHATVAESAFKPEIPTQPLPKVAPVPVPEESAAPAPPPKPAVDPVAELTKAFDQALASGKLLTPADESAKHFLEALAASHPTHEATQRARTRLSTELLARADQAVASVDIEAAKVWIDQAEQIGAEASLVQAARTRVVDQQVALESAKPVPASALKVTAYVKPVYPARALERGLEGWVDVEFTVEPDGSTSHVTVANASHDTWFRREATAAVEQWKFEPRVFMNRTIPQRSYTRIRFVQ